MLITITTTMDASPDGVTIRRYVAGEIHQMPEALAAVFLAQRWGHAAPEEKPEPAPEKKAHKGPKENK